MCRSQFPDNINAFFTLAGKVHSDEPKERTGMRSIAHSVDEVIESKDGSLRIPVRLMGKVT